MNKNKDLLINDKGEIVKCECGGIYIWDGSIKPSIPVIYPYRCNKCSSIIHKKGNKIYKIW